MFEFSWGHLAVIAIVTLVVIRPKELPAVMRTAGQWMSKIRRMAAEFQSQFQEAMREAEMADVKKHFDDIGSAARSLPHFDPIGTVRREIEGAIAKSDAKRAPAPDAAAPPPDVTASEAPAEPITASAEPPAAPSEPDAPVATREEASAPVTAASAPPEPSPDAGRAP